MKSAADSATPTALKRRRQRHEASDEGPPPVDIRTPEGPKTKKKKKKRKTEEEPEASPPSSAVASKRRRKEEKLQLDSRKNSKEEKKKKKEKKKRKAEQEEEKNDVDVTVPKEKNSKRKKKKKSIERERKEEEEEEEEGGEEEQQQDEGRVKDFSEKLLDELQEFVPDVKKKSQDEINKLLRYDLQRFRRFKQQGVAVRRGRYTEEENDRIIQNVADFLVLTGIGSANQLLFPDRHQQGAEIRKLKAQHQFLVKIAEGIPRTCQQVYTRAVKLLDDANHLGRFSEEELRSLVKLQNLHGNDWKKISQKMGRSALSLEKRFAQLAARHGAWSFEETSRLTQAVKAHLEVLVQQGPAVSREQLCNNLPWKEISSQVSTRSWSQCRLKWFTILKSKMASQRPSSSSQTIESLKFRIRLINTLYNLQVDDQADVDWDEVAASMGDVTPICVQKGFHRLKVSRVSKWSSLSFGAVVDFLDQNVLPQLKDKLRRKMSEEAEQGAEQNNLSYLMSDIFSSEDEDGFTEVDNS